jgi:hypothetical protein
VSRQVSAPVRGVEVGRRFPVSVKGVAVQAGKVLLLVMPEGYKRSIAAWFARLNGHAAP